MKHITRRVKMGLLLIAPQRFQKIGEGTVRESYFVRKEKEAQWMKSECEKIADVTFPGVIYTTEDVKAAINSFVYSKVDFVLAIYLSWAEDFMWARFLRDMPPCPVLFCHRERDEIKLGDTHDDDEFAEFLCCGGLVGTLEASGSIKRMKRAQLMTFTGTWDMIMNRAKTFGNAAKVSHILHNSRIGLLACMNEVMWSTYVDPYDVFCQVGPEVCFISVAELKDQIAAVDDLEVNKVHDEITSRYRVLSDVDEIKFRASIKASIGMEKLAAKKGVDLLVLNDIDTVLFEHIGLRPGFWPTSDEVETLIVPEGDIGGGLATYVLKLLSGGHVNFIEPFHIDRLNGNFAAGHAGPNDYRDENGDCVISSDVRFAKTKWKYAGAPFAWYVFPKGEKTMLHCSEQTGHFQFVATRVEALKTEHFLASYSHSLFRPMDESCEELFEKLIKQGVTQHYGIAEGNRMQEISDLAFILGVEFQAV